MLSIVGTNPYYFISGIIAVTIILTEVMSNNAAALIVFPIALTAAKLAGFTSPEAAKAVGVAVAVGASCAFAIPTGYQTHMIVYGPGGYKFSDFLRVGVPMDVIGWLLATAIIPLVWQIY
jgi:di/tricarboxylate transporter